MDSSQERAASALQAIDPGTNRDTWMRVAMAAKDAGLTLNDFTEWSRPAANFGSDRECATLWNSITPGAVTAGTLYDLAHSQGWKDPGTGRVNGHRARAVAHAEAAPARTSATPQRPTIDALAVWNRCEPATGEHGYIIAKRGRADGLRVVAAGDSLAIGGHAVAGWLAVPALSVAGELRTLQFVPPPVGGNKLNLPGASFVDGFFTVGTLDDAPCAYIVEGIGQAWACHNATGCAAVVCFGIGRMATVARALRNSCASLRLVLVPDRGQEAKAEAIAKDVRAEWVEMPADKPSNYDANDYAAEHGADSLATLLETPKTPAMRYRLLSAAELMDVPPLQWLVRGVLPSAGLASIFGASGSGKSFLALDLCTAIATGAVWFGCRVKAAPVAYLCLEGAGGFTLRMQAWEAHHGRKVPQAMRFITQSFDLRNADDVAELVDAVKAQGCAGGVLVIDTMNAAATGTDENASRDMGELISASKRLQTELSALVLLIHHSGKDQTRGLRGHSSLHAALDAAIEVTRVGNAREWRVAKNKDGSDGDAHPFGLRIVTLGKHEDGEPITSCVVTGEVAAQSARRVLPPKSGNQRISWDALGEVLRKAGDARPDGAPESLPKGKPALAMDAAIASVADRLACDPKRRRERAQQALEGLHAKGLIRIEAGFVWVT
jgi:KaiC/GvpD/RAD55 family RecA-like ATPase